MRKSFVEEILMEQTDQYYYSYKFRSTILEQSCLIMLSCPVVDSLQFSVSHEIPHLCLLCFVALDAL